jgi:hypothetical protein
VVVLHGTSTQRTVDVSDIVTFFRIGIRANPANRSRWAVRDLMTRRADRCDGRRFRSTSAQPRRTRLGGCGHGSVCVWNEDWEASLDGPTHRLRAAARDRHALVGRGDAAMRCSRSICI